MADKALERNEKADGEPLNPNAPSVAQTYKANIEEINAAINNAKVTNQPSDLCSLSLPNNPIRKTACPGR